MPKGPDKHSDKDSTKSLWDYANIGYIAAGLSTLLSAWFSIGENHAKDVYEREIPEFKKIDGDRVAANAALHNKKGLSFAKYLEERKTINTTYNNAYKGLLKEMGITNSVHKFRDMKPHQQLKVGLTVFAVASIALGATYSYVQGRKVDKIRRDQEKQEQTQLG